MNPMSNPVSDRLLGDRRRVVVEHVRPTVDGGEFPAKATRGLPQRVSARAFADGHDPLLAWVWLVVPTAVEVKVRLGGANFTAVPLPLRAAVWVPAPSMTLSVADSRPA